MTEGAFEARARALVGDRLRAGAPLAPLTTFRIGGPADWFADVTSTDELRALLEAARGNGVPVTMLGGGSNVLVADAGVRGLVIRPRLMEIAQRSETIVRAESGVSINGLVRWTIGRGLAGLEAWAGTPGTVGGAVFGNAHWGGRNIGEIVTTVGLVTPGGELLDVPREAMGFAYDTSRIQTTGEIVVWAELALAPGGAGELRDRARASLHYRKRTQPLALPSAGCIFRNPDASVALPAGVPLSAGALIDRAGLKGYRVGGARISETHANFIVNDGTATARDVRDLIERARAAVADRFGIVLRDEIVYLGAF